MHILITAGGTSEKIDRVRSITNHSTGKLGKQIAEDFLANGHQVTYLTTPYALRPLATTNLAVLEIETTKELETVLIELFEETQFDSVVHSMAVSDFTTETSLTEDSFIEKLAEQLMKKTNLSDLSTLIEALYQNIDAISQTDQQEKKISSDTDRLLLFLKKNPKIIAMIRKKQPRTILVGFKLLVGVSKEKLIRVGLNTLHKNECDFVLANDLETINSNQHLGFLINPSGQSEVAKTKAEIAEKIVKNVEANWRLKQ